MSKGLFLDRHEKLNTISHAIGIVLGLVGLFFLIGNSRSNSSTAQFSILVYSGSIILMFAVSTLYHGAREGALKNKLRILDHISIYLLIAGTYTPVTLLMLEKGNGMLIFYSVWGIALVGTIMKLFFTGKYEALSLVLYLIMGWLIVLDFRSLLEKSSFLGMVLLSLGGLLYTVGIIFYANRKIRYNHFIWHLFVLGGAICHWFFIWYDVV